MAILSTSEYTTPDEAIQMRFKMVKFNIIMQNLELVNVCHFLAGRETSPMIVLSYNWLTHRRYVN